MRLKQAEAIRDQLYAIRDGVYIGKYSLQQVKPKLAAIINQLFAVNDDELAHQIANELQSNCLSQMNVTESDINDEHFWRSLSAPLMSIDTWVIKYVNTIA